MPRQLCGPVPCASRMAAVCRTLYGMRGAWCVHLESHMPAVLRAVLPFVVRLLQPFPLEENRQCMRCHLAHLSWCMLWCGDLLSSWGRGQETPGEDPTLNGQYGSMFIAGFQGSPQPTGVNTGTQRFVMLALSRAVVRLNATSPDVNVFSNTIVWVACWAVGMIVLLYFGWHAITTRRHAHDVVGSSSGSSGNRARRAGTHRSNR